MYIQHKAVPAPPLGLVLLISFMASTTGVLFVAIGEHSSSFLCVIGYILCLPFFILTYLLGVLTSDSIAEFLGPWGSIPVLAVTQFFYYRLIIVLISSVHAGTKPFPPGYCPTCGYDLTGNDSCICPECGKLVPKEVMDQLTADPPKQ